MIYTFQIDDSQPQAQALLEILRLFQKEYNFVSLVEKKGKVKKKANKEVIEKERILKRNQEMISILRKHRENGIECSFGDALEYQKEIRKDKPLHNRI